MRARHVCLAVVALAAAGLASASSSAVDFGFLMEEVDFDTAVAAILGVAGLMVLPAVARWGARKVLEQVDPDFHRDSRWNSQFDGGDGLVSDDQLRDWENDRGERD